MGQWGIKKAGLTRKITHSPPQESFEFQRTCSRGAKVRSQIWNEVFWIWSESLSLFCVKAAPPRGLGLTHSCPFRTHSKRALSRTKSPKNPFFRKKPSRAPKSTKLVPFRPPFQNRSAPNVSSASHFHASSFTPIHFELKFSEFVRFFFFFFFFFFPKEKCTTLLLLEVCTHEWCCNSSKEEEMFVEDLKLRIYLCETISQSARIVYIVNATFSFFVLLWHWM